MRKQLFLLAFVLILQSSLKAQTTIVVENKTNQQRSELISISAEQLGVKPRTKLIVRDVFDIEQPTQWTYDGRLLMSTNVAKKLPPFVIKTLAKGLQTEKD